MSEDKPYDWSEDLKNVRVVSLDGKQRYGLLIGNRVVAFDQLDADICFVIAKSLSKPIA